MREAPGCPLQTARGLRLGSYKLLLQIGRGGMADVFLALAPPVGGAPRRQVVVKQLRREIVEDDEFRAMFMDEARLATRLAHPNVVTTYAVEQANDERFLVMEFLDGQALSRIRQRAKSKGGVPLGVHLRVIADVLSGVHYLHELRDQDGRSLGVVHRDVTPHNVFVTYDGHVKVVDFGIAKAASRLAETRVGVVKGKLAYMSPESVRGEQVDRRSDVFSIGVMLWEAAAGARFWSDHDELTVFRRLVSGELPLGGAREHGIHPRLRQVILKAIEPRPEARFSTAEEMLGELDKLLLSQAQHGGRRLVGEHVIRAFADDRESFHEQVHAALVELDSDRDLPVAPPLRSGPLVPLPLDASPISTAGAGTLRTVTTSGQASNHVAPTSDARRRSGAAAWVAAAALAVLSMGGIVVRQRLQLSRAEQPIVLVSNAVRRSANDPVIGTPRAATVADDDRSVPRISADGDGGAMSHTAGHAGPPVAAVKARPVRRAPTTAAAYSDLPNAVRTRRSLDQQDPWAP